MPTDGNLQEKAQLIELIQNTTSFDCNLANEARTMYKNLGNSYEVNTCSCNVQEQGDGEYTWHSNENGWKDTGKTSLPVA